jgi:lipoyl-dependent peroxiredoxin
LALLRSPRNKIRILYFTWEENLAMITRKSEAEWKGDLMNGTGTMTLGSGAYRGAYGFRSRFESGPGTNPEELIAAAHAGCYSMALSAELSGKGHAPTKIHTTASVVLDKVGEGFAITHINLETEAEVPGLSDAEFQQFAESAKKNCPVSKALAGSQISLKAKLL